MTQQYLVNPLADGFKPTIVHHLLRSGSNLKLPRCGAKVKEGYVTDKPPANSRLCGNCTR